MKIVHINTTQTGGAALCAKRIMSAEIEQGIDCRMINADGQPNEITSVIERDPSIWNRNYILRKTKNQFIKLGLGNDSSTWSYQIEKKLSRHGERLYYHVPLSDYKNLIDHPWIREADLIHLHWVSGMLDYPGFFGKIDKPVVWTLHDKYPAVGLQHYTNSEFHLLPEYLKSDEIKCLRIKKDAVEECKNMHLVAISKEMEQLCQNSPVLQNCPVSVINNGVDTNVFRYKQSSIRNDLKISPDRTVFLFSAYWIEDKNKGLELLLRALEKLNDPKITVICIGNYNSVPETSLDIRCVGFISDTDILSELYSTANFFVLPSFEETFAQTPLEAMACGTPVIAFPVSGASELIRPENGIVCDGYTIESLCSGIRTAMGRTYNRQDIRNYIETHFAMSVISRQYIKLYRKILDNN